MALPVLVLIGAFAPTTPTVGRFGVFVSSDLPRVWLGAVAAVALSLVAVLLRGGRPARLVLVASLIVAGGLLVVFAAIWGFAASAGSPYSPLRQLQPPNPTRLADRSVDVATLGDGHTLRAHVWTRPDDAETPGPALVYVHGGAFVGGGLDSRPSLFQALADGGITVIDVEYRLAPPVRWSDSPADVLCSLVWVRGHAAELGVDPDRVFVAGDSAGGSLALVAGYAAGSSLLSPSCPGTPVTPAGVIAIAPAADLAAIWSDGTIGDASGRFPEAYIGGAPSAYPERYEMASPFRLLRPGLPRTLVIQGANDHLVLAGHASELADRLRAAGVPCDLVVVPFADHGFDGDANGFGGQLVEGLIPAFVAAVGR